MPMLCEWIPVQGGDLYVTSKITVVVKRESLCVLVRFLLLWWSTITKSNLGRKGIISAYGYTSLRELMWNSNGSGNWRQELKQKSWRIAENWVTVSWVVHTAFLWNPWPPGQGVNIHIGLESNPLFKKMYYRLTCRPIFIQI